MIERLLRLRGGGHAKDGASLLMDVQQKRGLDDLDLDLLYADNTCSALAFGEGCTTARWFTFDPSSRAARRAYGNHHRISYDGGKTWICEAALLEATSPGARCDPAEVVWHLLRVRELQAQGIERSERVKIMTEERAAKPWAIL